MADNKAGTTPEPLDATDIVYDMMSRVSVSIMAWFKNDSKVSWNRAAAEASPLAASLRIVFDYAKHNRLIVGDHVTRVYAALRYFAAPICLGVRGAPSFGDEFYRTPLGHAILEAEVYATDDELVSASDAAKLAKLSASSMSQYITRGALIGYPDSVVPNRTFVRRKALVEFIAERKAKARKRSRRPLDKRPK